MSVDGRCDTPGYNAKYYTYSTMSQSNSKILHFHVVTMTETSSSVAIENYGIIKSLDKLQYWDLDIACIRLSSVNKEIPSPCHQLNIWQKPKNIKKKLTKLAKSKTCIELQNWIKALINRFLVVLLYM